MGAAPTTLTRRPSLNAPENTPKPRWTTSKWPLVRWLVTLSPLESMRLEGLLAVIQVILEEGNEQRVFRVQHPQVSPNQAVERYIETLRQTDGGRPKLWGWDEAREGWHCASRVALTPGAGPKWTHGPEGVIISSPPLVPGWPVEISIGLRSDVWFDRLPALRMMDGHHRPPNPYSERAVDNAHLAQQHTPGLNAFLQGVAQSVRIFGGQWALDDTQAGAWYRPMCHEHGILLQ